MTPVRYRGGMDISDTPAQHYEYSIQFNSPWLAFERPRWSALDANATCDVAIIGGGISGVATLYYLLTETNHHVILFEKGQVAGQATGNNAGLACIHIERPIQDLVEEFGLEKTRQSFIEIDQSWELMVSILDAIGAKKLLEPLPNISLGMTSVSVLLEHIEREKYNREFGRTRWNYFVVDDPQITHQLPPPEKIAGIDIQVTPKEKLLQMLHIFDEDFIAIAVPEDDLKLGRLNSAKFCFLVLSFLSKYYPERFSLYENTPISCIREDSNVLMLTHPAGQVTANDVVLCTNGYKDFEIYKQSGIRFERLHNSLIPREGYMAAFKDPLRIPYAQAFFDDRGTYADSPYFYLSHTSQLTILGGPEFDQPDGHHDKEMIIQRALLSQKIYRKFLRNTYQINDCHFTNFWYGIMGYTSNGVRWVGEEPQFKHLWYNLGCNGIGITTSIGAAKRLVALMQGQPLPPSIFDP